MPRTSRGLATGLVLTMVLTVVPTAAHADSNPEGRIACWGNDVNQQCTLVPHQVSQSLDGKTVVDLSALREHVVALTSDGVVHAWGSPGLNHGQAVVPASLTGTPVARVFAGSTYSIALTEDDEVVEWGQAIAGTEVQEFSNRRATSGSAAPVIDIGPGGGHALALLADGIVVAWGSPGGASDYGQPPHTPGRPLQGKRAVAIGASQGLSGAVTTQGEVLVWGIDNAATEAVLDVPDGPGEALHGKTAVDLALGEKHALALTSEGKVVAWGDPMCQPDGPGSTPVDCGPTTVPATLASKHVVAIDVGFHHSLALTSEGQLFAWGAGSGGEISGSVHWGQSTIPASLTGKRVLKPAAHRLGTQALYQESNPSAQTPTVTVEGLPVSVQNGTSLEATVTVAPNPGSRSWAGHVEVFDGAAKIAQVPVVGGSATVAIPAPAPGAHTYRFRYTGSPGLHPAESTRTVTVLDGKIPTTTTLSAPASVSQGTSHTATVTVSPAGATGQVQLTGLPGGPHTQTLSGGTATFPISNTLGADTYTLTASYQGTVTHEVSASAPRVLVVEPDTTVTPQVTVTNPPVTAPYGQISTGTTVTVTAGDVEITDGKVELWGPEGKHAPWAAYSGTPVGLNVPVLPVGTHTLTYRYVSAGPPVIDAESDPYTFTVTKAPTAVAAQLDADAPYGTARQVVVVVPKASNPAAYPSGTVTVTGLPGGPVAADLELGSAMVTLPATTPAGSHTLTVIYAGDANHAPSSSAPLTLSVAKATPRVIVTGLDDSGPYGTVRQVTVSVDSGVNPTGAITVTGVPGGTLTGMLAGGTATVTLPATVPAGNHAVTVAYSGDANHGPSSATATLTVTAATPTMQVSGLKAKSRYGTLKRATVTVSSTLTPEGTVEVRRGAKLLGSATLSAGKATVTLPRTLAAKAHTLSYRYVPAEGSSFAPAATSVTHTVRKARTTVKATWRAKPKAGKRGTLRVKVTPRDGTVKPKAGKVWVLKGKKRVGTAKVRKGVALVKVSKLARGKHTLKVVYRGNAKFAKSPAVRVKVTVR